MRGMLLLFFTAWGICPFLQHRYVSPSQYTLTLLCHSTLTPLTPTHPHLHQRHAPMPPIPPILSIPSHNPSRITPTHMLSPAPPSHPGHTPPTHTHTPHSHTLTHPPHTLSR
jgi:hypothetical protein